MSILGGNVGIGTNTPSAKLVSIGDISLLAGDSTADTTSKSSRFGMLHYDTDEEPLGMMYAQSTDLISRVVFGGGTSQFNAPTQIEFRTSANTTTPTGTVRMSIIDNGNVGIGTDTPDSELEVVGNVKVTDDAYNSAWNGSVSVPTKNAVYDKIETLSGGGATTSTGGVTYVTNQTDDFVVGGTDSSGELWFDESLGDLYITGAFNVPQYISHTGDVNTGIEFYDDIVKLKTGGSFFMVDDYLSTDIGVSTKPLNVDSSEVLIDNDVDMNGDLSISEELTVEDLVYMTGNTIYADNADSDFYITFDGSTENIKFDVDQTEILANLSIGEDLTVDGRSVVEGNLITFDVESTYEDGYGHEAFQNEFMEDANIHKSLTGDGVAFFQFSSEISADVTGSGATRHIEIQLGDETIILSGRVK